MHKKAKCDWCGINTNLKPDGTMVAHHDIYPWRWCEGGNRKPGDTGPWPGKPKSGVERYKRRFPQRASR